MTTQTAQQVVVQNQLFQFLTTPIVSSVGNNISQPSTTQFQLLPGYTYKLTAALNYATNETSYQWYDITNSKKVGVGGEVSCNSNPQNGTAVAYVTPTTPINVGLITVSIYGINNTVAASTTDGRCSWATIEMIGNVATVPFVGATTTTPGSLGIVPAPLSGQQNYYLQGNGNWSAVSSGGAIVGSSGVTPAQYYMAIQPVDNTTATLNQLFSFSTTPFMFSPGIPVTQLSSTQFQLLPGCTYKLTTALSWTGIETVYQWYNSTNSTYLGFPGTCSLSPNVWDSISLAYITPTTPINVGVMIKNMAPGFTTYGVYTDYNASGRAPWLTIEVVNSIASYYITTQPAAQTATPNLPFPFITTPLLISSGTLITQPSTTQFQLVSGYTYKLTAALAQCNGLTVYQWYDNTNNNKLGVSGANYPTFPMNTTAIAYVTPAATITVGLIIQSSSATSVSSAKADGRSSWAMIEVVSSNTSYYMTTQTAQQVVVQNQLFQFLTTPIVSSVGNNISQPSTTQFQLLPGYTYKLTAALNYTTSETSYQWYDITNNKKIGVGGEVTCPSNPQNGTAIAYVTPSAPINLGLITVSIQGSNNIVAASTTDGRCSWATIEMIGNVATVPFVGATATTTGSLGIVPAPPIGGNKFLLNGSGNWSAVGNSINVGVAQFLHVSKPNTDSMTYTTGSGITFQKIVGTSGNSIHNTVQNSVFVLQPGYTYKLTGNLNAVSSAGTYQWYNTTSGSTGYIGLGGYASTGNLCTAAIAYITPTSPTTVSLCPINNSMTFAPYSGNIASLTNWVMIEAMVITQYIQCANTNTTGTYPVNGGVNFQRIVSSAGTSITMSGTSSLFNLSPGYTYKLTGNFNTVNSTFAYRWYNQTTSAYIGSGGYAAAGYLTSVAVAYITPTVATTVLLAPVDATMTNFSYNGSLAVICNWATVEAVYTNTPLATIGGVPYDGIANYSHRKGNDGTSTYPAGSSGHVLAEGFNFEIDISSQNTLIGITGSQSQFILPAGYTYKLSGGLGATSVSGGVYQWYNYTPGYTGYIGTCGYTKPGYLNTMAVAYITTFVTTSVVLSLPLNTSGFGLTTYNGSLTTICNWSAIEVVYTNALPSSFLGATSSTSGSLGLVPAPTAGQQTYYLSGNGTWSPLIKSLNLMTAIALSGVQSASFPNIPSYANRITVVLDNAVIGSAQVPLLQLGGSGSIPTNDCQSSTTQITASSTLCENFTDGFRAAPLVPAASGKICSGSYVLTRVPSNVWICTGTFKFDNSTTHCGGRINLGVFLLDLIKLSTSNGTGTFTTGVVHLLYE
jgi:hypothetical protein